MARESRLAEAKLGQHVFAQYLTRMCGRRRSAGGPLLANQGPRSTAYGQPHSPAKHRQWRYCLLSVDDGKRAADAGTPGHRKFQTAITYFFHDGALYGDAISAPAGADAVRGYRAIPMDETPLD